MLLQTNSYIVPKEKRAEHARLMRRFRQILNRIGCEQFEVYEQVGANWANGQTTGRFVQIMRFRDRKHQLEIQSVERSDPAAQQLIAEFCELINYQYQVDQKLFVTGYYNSAIPIAPMRMATEQRETPPEQQAQETAPQEDPPNGEPADADPLSEMADHLGEDPDTRPV